MWRHTVQWLTQILLHVIWSVDVHIGSVRVDRDAHLANVGVVNTMVVSDSEIFQKSIQCQWLHLKNIIIAMLREVVKLELSCHGEWIRLCHTADTRYLYPIVAIFHNI